MATNPNEIDGWAIDPSNPNRAIYTDPDTGDQYEYVAPAQPEAAAPKAPQEPVKVTDNPRGFTERLGDSFKEGGQYGFPGLVARAYQTYVKDRDPEQVAQAQRELRQMYEKRNEMDPVFRPDDNWLQTLGILDREDGSNAIEQGAAYLGGQLLGSAGPEQLLMPGGTAGARVAGQAVIGGVSDLAYQGKEMLDGVIDEISALQALAGAAMGAGFQSAVELPNFIKNLFRERGIDTTPRADPREGTPYDPANLKNPEAPALEVEVVGGRPMTAEERLQAEAEQFQGTPEMTAEELFAPKPRQTLEEEAAAFQGSREPTVEDVFGEAAPAPSREPTPQDLFPEPEPEYVPTPRQQAAADRINEFTKDWENSPSIEVHENFDGVEGIDPEAIGVTRPDGSIAINLDAIEKQAATSGLSQDDLLAGVTFHEGLGHYGLVQRFGDDLDGMLDDLYYNGNSNFIQKVDEWMEANPDAYAGSGKELTRAVEEVLAEMSEAGSIDRTMMDRIRDFIKNYGRELGLNLKYSDREIRSILGMAHDAVRNGETRDVAGNGFKYAKVWHGTPHDFDQFDHSKMGSGEGFQVYGWGTYLTETKGVAEGYRDKLSRKHFGEQALSDPMKLRKEVLDEVKPGPLARDHIAKAIQGSSQPTAVLKRRGDYLEKSMDDLVIQNSQMLRAIEDLRERGGFLNSRREKKLLSKISDNLKTSKTLREEANDLYRAIDVLNEKSPKKGKLYEVEIPDDGWLLWDRPLSEQPQVKAAFESAGYTIVNREGYERMTDQAEIAYQRYRDAVEEKGIRSPEARQARLDHATILQRQKEAIVERGDAGDVYNDLSWRIGQKETSELLANAGIVGNKYLDGYSRYKGEGSYNYVVFDEKNAPIVNKYMKPRDNMSMSRRESERKALTAKARDARYAKLDENWQREQELFWSPEEGNNPRYMRPKKENEKAQPRRVGGINLDNISNAKDLEYILSQSTDRLAENNPDFRAVVPRAVTIREAREMGLTPSKIMKPGMDQSGLAARIEAGASLLAYQTGKIQKLLDRSVGASDNEAKNIQRQLIKEFATLEAVHGRVMNNNSEVGRALNILNRVRSATQTTDDLLKYMAKNGNQVLTNPAMLAQLQQQMASIPTTAGKVKMARAAMKKGAEDYIFRVWYNMLLSAPPTHVANFVGTAGNFVADLLENTGAAVIGQVKRGNADRIRAREVGYRVWGAVKALQDASTWSKARQSLNTGLTGNMPNVKAGTGGVASNVYSGSNPALGFAAGVLESPTRALAGADEWWRNVLHLSSIYGLAVRNAGNKGYKGQAFWDEVRDLINNPTPEMIETSNDYTKTLQFLDKPSWIGKAVINAQTPSPSADVTERVGKAGLKFFIPFVRTPDSLIRTALRRTPIGILERENVNGWRAGGAERDKVIARLTMGSMLAAYVASQAMEGNITGQGPSDYRKKAEWLGSHQENSIKVGDEWISIAGLEPVSTNITGIATIVERLKSGDVDEAGYFEMAGDAVRGLANVLVENSYMEGLQSLSEVFSSDEQKQGNALQNFLAGLASSITTPAIVRKYAQTQDPAVRDTTGDGSFGDRVEGRMTSGVPGLSQELPQRYDVYGRPMTRDFAGPNMLSRAASKPVDDDPTIKEIERLAATTDKVVFGAPKKSGIKVNGEERRLTAQEFQNYQAVSGAWAVSEVANAMADPEWSASSDEEKIAWIKDIVEQVRAATREYLFNPDGDEEELSDTNEE